jgi:hypothetical protein
VMMDAPRSTGAESDVASVCTRPPTRCLASSTTTLTPILLKWRAAISPAGPAPTTTTVMVAAASAASAGSGASDAGGGGGLASWPAKNDLMCSRSSFFCSVSFTPSLPSSSARICLHSRPPHPAPVVVTNLTARVARRALLSR